MWVNRPFKQLAPIDLTQLLLDKLPKLMRIMCYDQNNSYYMDLVVRLVDHLKAEIFCILYFFKWIITLTSKKLVDE